MLLCFVVKKHQQPPYISQQQLTKALTLTTELKMTIGHRSIISVQRMSTLTVDS